MSRGGRPRAGALAVAEGQALGTGTVEGRGVGVPGEGLGKQSPIATNLRRMQSDRQEGSHSTIYSFHFRKDNVQFWDGNPEMNEGTW